MRLIPLAATMLMAAAGFAQDAQLDALRATLASLRSHGSIDPLIHHREAVRHFLIEGDQVRRVDPVALSPRDAVDEWLTRDWTESATWPASLALRDCHNKLKAVYLTFADTTMHCQTPDLWQLAVEPHNPQRKFEPEPNVYFLVRWRPPFHFTMMNISAKPWPRCNQEAPEADEWRTLFPIQEWR